MDIMSSRNPLDRPVEEKLPTDTASPTPQEPLPRETEAAPPDAYINLRKLIILAVCTNVTNVLFGYDFNAAAVVFNEVALDLHVVEKDLQWISNTLFLALVRISVSSYDAMQY